MRALPDSGEVGRDLRQICRKRAVAPGIGIMAIGAKRQEILTSGIGAGAGSDTLKGQDRESACKKASMKTHIGANCYVRERRPALIWVNATQGTGSLDSTPMMAIEHARTDGRLHRSPIDLIEHEHLIQARLCDSLERIADDLPNNVDRRLCGQVIDSLQFEMPLHHRDEELGLFPLIEKRALPTDNIHDILARLALEHATDESFASELLESLENLREGRRLKNPDMVGYMLRSFFESYRRHILWENAIVLPLARMRLTREDLDELNRAMVHHRQ